MARSKWLGLLANILLFLVKTAECSNILAVFVGPGRSQYILAEPLLIALAERGHNVTVISGFETKGIRNLRSIEVNLTYEGNEADSLFTLQDLTIFENIAALHDVGLFLTRRILSDSNVQELINSKEEFDLVIVETFLNEAHLAFAKHFNAHLVLFSSLAVSEWNSHLMGNPLLPSYVPIMFSGYTTSMNFYERFRNTMALWYDRYYRYFYQTASHQLLVDKYFPKKYDLTEIMYNASIMFTCSHVGTTESTAIVPSIIEVAGLHIKNNKLPQNIQKFLDAATDGAIYVSMGTNIPTTGIPKELLNAMFNVFSNLKQKVIWKLDVNEFVPSENVLISNWLPQTDILAHPNVKLFISHCGMGGTTETINYGVPVIGIPMYGDQPMNMNRLKKYGMAIELPFRTLSESTLKRAIDEVINNETYLENAKKRSKIMNDRLVKPLDEAIYWVEYVIRHDGAHHLKSSAHNLSWFQLYLGDIILAILLVPYLLYVSLRLLVRRTK